MVHIMDNFLQSTTRRSVGALMETLGDWQRTHYSKEIKPEMDNQEVILMGFVRELRDIGKLKFIKLADREGFIQIIAKILGASPPDPLFLSFIFDFL